MTRSDGSTVAAVNTIGAIAVSSSSARHLSGVVGSSRDALSVSVGASAEIVGSSAASDGLHSVAVIGGSRASGRSVLQIGRARNAGAGAELGNIAAADASSAESRSGQEAVRWASGGGSSASFGLIANSGRRSASKRRRLERVGRARSAVTGAHFGNIARTSRRSASGSDGLEGIVGAVSLRAWASLGNIARTS